MSAPTLSVQQKIHSLKNRSAKQSSSAKAVLYSPYLPTWPVVDKKDLKEIITKLDNVFSETEIPLTVLQMKPELSRKREKKKPIKKKKTKEEAKLAKKDRDLLLKERQQMLAEARKDLSTPEGINLRKQLVKGIQEVTKQLEKDNLRLVLVDRGSETIIHQHLVALSACRKCPAAAMRGLAETMRPHLRVGSLVAMGFKKRDDGDSDKFDSMIDFVSKRLPPIEYSFHNNPDLDVDDSGEQKGVTLSQSSPLQGSSTDSAENKSSESNDSTIPVAANTDSLYVYKTVADNDFGSESFISFGQDEIEDVTFDEEPNEPCHFGIEQPTEPWNFGRGHVVSKRKRKRKQNEQEADMAKKKKESNFRPAKIGRVKSNVDRKKKKKRVQS